jgi:hypothetical protein
VPLPADGQPKDFAGAVGQFTLTPGELPRDIKMNNAFSYRVTLRGEGNFNAIDRLNFVPPSGVESFDLKIEKDKNAKTFEYILIPRKGGSILLPPVALSYFDPRKDAYTTITVPAQNIQVSGQASSETPRPPPPPDSPQATASPVAPSAPLLKETLPSPTVRWLRESAGIWAAALAWTAVALGLIIRTARAAKARGPLVRRTKKATVQSLAKQWKRKHSQLPSPSDLEDMRYALLHAVRDERGLETPIDRRRAVEDVLIDLKSTAPGDPVWSELSSSLQQLQRLGFSSASPEEKTASWRAVLERLSLIKPR